MRDSLDDTTLLYVRLAYSSCEILVSSRVEGNRARCNLKGMRWGYRNKGDAVRGAG